MGSWKFRQGRKIKVGTGPKGPGPKTWRGIPVDNKQHSIHSEKVATAKLFSALRKHMSKFLQGKGAR